jgi:hypothetical protein
MVLNRVHKRFCDAANYRSRTLAGGRARFASTARGPMELKREGLHAGNAHEQLRAAQTYGAHERRMLRSAEGCCLENAASLSPGDRGAAER